MWSGEVPSLGFFAVAAVLPLLSVNGLYCPLPGLCDTTNDRTRHSGEVYVACVTLLQKRQRERRIMSASVPCALILLQQLGGE